MWPFKKKICTCVREQGYLLACKNCIAKALEKIDEHKSQHPECYPGL